MPTPATTGQTPFVGRERELAGLVAHLDAAGHGRGSLVLLAGEPGVGKTRLAEELAAIAGQQGMRTLWGRCYEGEGAPAFWPWVEILRAAVRGQHPETLRRELGWGVTDLAQLVPEIRALLPDLPAPPALDPAQARFRLFDAVTTFLVQAAATQPLVLILDDLHWADTPSLLLLAFLARDLAGARLLVIATYRDVEVRRGHPLAQTLGDLARRPHVARLVLGGLTAAEVSRVIQSAAGGIPDPPVEVVAALAAETAGNPLFVTEMVRLLTTEGWPAEWPAAGGAGGARALPVPQTVREVIGRRLDRLSPECNRVLAVASVIGRDFGVDALGRAGRGDPPGRPYAGAALLEVLEEAEAARVIQAAPDAPGRYRFTHALIRETLYEDLPSTRRVRLHGHVGAALEAGYGSDVERHLAELAWHFAQAAPAGEVDRAVRYAERAAERATRLHAHEEAVAHYESALRALALRTPVDEERRCELLLALGQAQARAGDYQAVNDTFARVADIARALWERSGGQRAAALLARAAIGSGGNVPRLGLVDARWVGLLEEALAALDEGDSPLRSLVLSNLANALQYDAAQERCLAISEAALAMARRCGDPIALETALAARWFPLLDFHHREERLAVVAEALRLAEDTGNHDLALRMRRWRIENLLEVGDIAGVDAELALLVRLADELRQPFTRWRAMVLQVMRAVLDGRFGEADAQARLALTRGERVVGNAAVPVFQTQIMVLRLEQGRLDDLEPALTGEIAQHPEPTWLCALAFLYTGQGRMDEARRVFERLTADDFAALPRAYNWAVNLSTLAEVCAALEDTRRAAALYDLLAPYAGSTAMAIAGVLCRGAVTHYLGVLAATLRRWDAAVRHFEDALATHTRMGTRPYVARTQHACAAMLLARWNAERGTRNAEPDARWLEQARDLVQPALATARELGMAWLAGEAEALQARVVATLQAEPSTLTPDTAFPDGLTAREVEVLRLLTAGKTNKEIADELVLSDRTVGRHIENIYTKIGARRRADAAAYALRHGFTAS